jgi:hypothetical protein
MLLPYSLQSQTIAPSSTMIELHLYTHWELITLYLLHLILLLPIAPFSIPAPLF